MAASGLVLGTDEERARGPGRLWLRGERVLVKELQISAEVPAARAGQVPRTRLQSRAFYAQANLLTGSLLEKGELFWERVREFHDRSGHA